MPLFEIRVFKDDIGDLASQDIIEYFNLVYDVQLTNRESNESNYISFNSDKFVEFDTNQKITLGENEYRFEILKEDNLEIQLGVQLIINSDISNSISSLSNQHNWSDLLMKITKLQHNANIKFNTKIFSDNGYCDCYCSCENHLGRLIEPIVQRRECIELIVKNYHFLIGLRDSIIQRATEIQSEKQILENLMDIEQEQVYTTKCSYDYYVALQDDIKASMPDCAVRVLLLLKNHYRNCDDNINNPILNDKEVEELLLLLDKHILDEEINILELDGKIKLFKEDVIDKKEPYLICSQLENILSILRPLDCDFLLGSLIMSENTAKSIKDEDIILFLGGTGVGKSTMIHYFCGSKFHFSERGLIPISVPIDGLENFITSNSMKSETRSVNAIKIMASEDSRVVPIWLADTPGFGDTDGSEMDIAGGLAIINAIRSCRSVRVVVLISELSIGDRGQGLQKLIATLVKFLPDIKAILQSFTFLFTKYKKGDDDRIRNTLKSKYRDLSKSEKIDEQFQCLLNCMISKTTDKVFIVDPLHDNHLDIMQVIMQTAPIYSPQLHFKHFVAQESLGILMKQLEILSKTIIVRLKRIDQKIFSRNIQGIQHDIEIVGHMLKQISLFANTLKLSECKDFMDDSLNHVVHYGKKISNTIITSINNFTDSSATKIHIYIGDVERVLVFIYTLSTLDNFTNLELSNESLIFFRKFCSNLFDEFSKCICESETTSINGETLCVAINLFNKLYLFGDAVYNIFKEDNFELQSRYKCATSHLDNFLIKQASLISDDVENSLDCILLLSQLCLDEDVKKKCTKSYQDCIDLYLQILISKCNSLLLVDSATVHPLYTEKSREIYEFFNDMKQKNNLSKRHPGTVEVLKSIESQIDEYLKKFSIHAYSAATNAISSNQSHLNIMQLILVELECLEDLRACYGIGTIDEYYKLDTEFNYFIDRLRKRTAQVIESLDLTYELFDIILALEYANKRVKRSNLLESTNSLIEGIINDAKQRVMMIDSNSELDALKSLHKSFEFINQVVRFYEENPIDFQLVALDHAVPVPVPVSVSVSVSVPVPVPVPAASETNVLRDGRSSSNSKRKLSSSVRTGDSDNESSAGKRRNKASNKRKNTQKYKGRTKVQKGDELKAEDMSIDSKNSESTASFSEPLPTLLTPQQKKVSYIPTLTQRFEEAMTSLKQAEMDAEAESRTFHSSYNDLVGRSLTSTQAVKSIVSLYILKLLCYAQKMSTTLVAALLSPYQQFMPINFVYDFTTLLDIFPSALSKNKQFMCSLADLFTTTHFSSIESSLYHACQEPSLYSACQDHTEQRYIAVIVEILIYIRDLKQSFPPNSSSSNVFCNFYVSGPDRVFNCASEYFKVVHRSISTIESESSQLLMSTIHLTKSLHPLDKFFELGFSSLSDQLVGRLNSSVCSKRERVCTLLLERNYKDIVPLLEDIAGSDALEKVEKDVTDSIDSLIKSLQQKVSIVSSEKNKSGFFGVFDFSSLVRDYRSIKEALQVLPHNCSRQKESCQQHVNKLKKELEVVVKSDERLNKFQYADVCRLVHGVELINETFLSLKENQSITCSLNNRLVQSWSIQISNINRAFEAALSPQNHLQNHYRNRHQSHSDAITKLSESSSNLNKVYKALKDANQVCKELKIDERKYNIPDAVNKLETSIADTLLLALQTYFPESFERREKNRSTAASKSSGSVIIDLGSKKMVIDAINGVINHLPEQLKERVFPQYDRCRMLYEEERMKHESELDKVVKTGDLKELVDKYMTSISKANYTVAESCFEKLETVLSKTLNCIESDLSNKNFQKAIESLGDIWIKSSSVYTHDAPVYYYGFWWEKRTLKEIQSRVNACFFSILSKFAKAYLVTIESCFKNSDMNTSLDNFSLYFRSLKSYIRLVFTESGQSSSSSLLCFITRNSDASIWSKLNDAVKGSLKYLKDLFQASKDRILSTLHCLECPETKDSVLDSTLVELIQHTKAYENAMNFFDDAQAFANEPICRTLCPNFAEIKMSEPFKVISQLLSGSVSNWGGKLFERLLCNETICNSPNASDRDSYYRLLSRRFLLLKLIKVKLPELIDSSLEQDMESSIFLHMRDQLADVASELKRCFTGIPTENTSLYVRVSNLHDNLRSFSEYFDQDQSKGFAINCISEVETELENVLEAKLEPTKKELIVDATDISYDEVADSLIDFKLMAVNISAYRGKVNSVIDKLLHYCKKSKDGVRKIATLSVELNSRGSSGEKGGDGVAQMLIAEHSVFQGFALSLRNTKTMQFTAEEVLSAIAREGNSTRLNKDSLLTSFKEYEKEYWVLVEAGLSDIKKQCENIFHKVASIRETEMPIKQKVRNFLVYVFSFWTLSNATHYLEAKDSDATPTGPMQATGKKKKTVMKDCNRILKYGDKYHLVLGLRENANKSEVNKRYKSLCVNHHPDKMPSDLTEQEKTIFDDAMKKINEARDELLKKAPDEPVSSTRNQDNSTPVSSLEDHLRNYLMQPHPAQVISILRFFDSVDDKEYPTIEKHFIQIPTGEGKSVTLAVTSVVLALLGFDVNCACYSKYLSDRDFNAFLTLFQAFNLQDNIKYGTFTQLADDFVNSEFADAGVRGTVQSVIDSKPHQLGRSITGVTSSDLVVPHAPRPRILLIDEVDVFFQKDFYGSMYQPIAKVSDPSVSALLKYIYTNRDSRTHLNLKVIFSSEEFSKCVERFPFWKELLEESVRAMITDVKSFQEPPHEYQVVRGEIAYADQDSLSFSKQFGYKTTFAYFLEHSKGRVDQETLNSRLYLLVKTGCWSYAEIPNQYHSVLGVTGTLATLSPVEKSLLKNDFQIKQYTFMPSIYGNKQLNFSGNSSDDVKISSSKSEYYMEIINEIKCRLIGSIDGTPRAVLVFFESIQSLENFYDSEQLRRSCLKDQIKHITEKTSANDKEALIRQAVTTGSITLLTKILGRGTDFIVYDEKLIASGGIHVIQTFVSEECSEEAQIKGRTARQGNKGSFSFVLLDSELEKYYLNSEDIKKMCSTKNMYDTIHQKRIQFFETKFPESMRYVKEIREDHMKARQFVKHLLNKDLSKVKDFLVTENTCPLAVDGSSRTIVLMDATGSMSALIQKTKNTGLITFIY